MTSTMEHRQRVLRFQEQQERKMTEAEQVDLGSRVHSVASNADALLKAAGTPEGRDELGMMLKDLTGAYWDLGKVLMKVGYATSNAAE